MASGRVGAAVLDENLTREPASLRGCRSVTKQDIEGVAAWLTNKGKEETRDRVSSAGF